MSSATDAAADTDMRQQDRKKVPDRHDLEQQSLAELQELAASKGVVVAADANRFVVIDQVLKALDAESRQLAEAERKLARLQREAEKQRDLQLAAERAAMERSKNAGFSREVVATLERRLARAKKAPHSLDLSNSRSGLQSPFAFEHVPLAVLQAFKAHATGKERDGASAASASRHGGSSTSGLKQLWLTNNRLAEVSSELRFIKSLEVLCLSGNRLTRLPAAIGGLKQLRRLFLNHNQLEELPEQLRSLQNLTDLHVDHNQLQTFSYTLTELRGLRRLSLCHNRIRQLPAEIRRLQNLVELHLDNNRIGPSLPNNLARLASSLKVLGVANNCLAALPPCIDELDLVVLRVEGNRSADYVITHPATDLIVPDVCIPRRLCDGLLQTKEGSAAAGGTGGGGGQRGDAPPRRLPGYLVEAEDFTVDNARWYDDSELEEMHQLLRTRAEATKQQAAFKKRRGAQLAVQQQRRR
jgi:hypothetical protein